MLPAQNALLELKLAAIKYLDYEDYLLLLGDKEDKETRRYQKIIIVEKYYYDSYDYFTAF